MNPLSAVWSQIAPMFSSEAQTKNVIAQTYVHQIHIVNKNRGLAAYSSFTEKVGKTIFKKARSDRVKSFFLK